MGNCVGCGRGPHVRVSVKRKLISVTYGEDVMYLRRNSVERMHYYHTSGEVVVRTTNGEERLVMPAIAQAELCRLVEKRYHNDFFILHDDAIIRECYNQ